MRGIPDKPLDTEVLYCMYTILKVRYNSQLFDTETSISGQKHLFQNLYQY